MRCGGGAGVCTALAGARAPAPVATAASAQLLGVAVLGGVIAFHEAGHFSAARVQNIRVDEFAIGFGPPLLQRRFKPAEEGGVNYVLRTLPLGGYVSFPKAREEDDEKDSGQPTNRVNARPGKVARAKDESQSVRCKIDPNDPTLFENKPFAQQALVVCAGIIFNLILSWMCIFGGAVSVGVPPPQPISIARVLDGTPAEAAGFRVGDKLIAINERAVTDYSDPMRGALGSIRKAVSAHAPFTATVERYGQPLSISVSPPEASTALGVQLMAQGPASTERVALPPVRAAVRATETVVDEVVGVSGQLLPALKMALSGNAQDAGLQGPIAISATAGRIAENNPALLLDFAALISVNLAVFNALPIPGLDGFQFLLLGVEALRGEKIGRRARNVIDSTAGFLFLYLVSNVIISDAGFGRISPSDFLITIVVTQLAFAGAESAIARRDHADGPEARKPIPRKSRFSNRGRNDLDDVQKKSRGLRSLFSSREENERTLKATRSQPRRSGPSASSRSGQNGVGESTFKRFVRRLARGTRSASDEDDSWGNKRRR